MIMIEFYPEFSKLYYVILYSSIYTIHNSRFIFKKRNISLVQFERRREGDSMYEGVCLDRIVGSPLAFHSINRPTS